MAAPVAVIGAPSRDTIRYVEKKQEFSQIGGGIYYAISALTSLGTEVVGVPLLSRNDEALLQPLQSVLTRIVPFWTQETAAFENIYPSDSVDERTSKFLSEAKGGCLSQEIFAEIRECKIVHLASITPHEFDRDLYATLRKRFPGKISLDGQGLARGKTKNIKSFLSGNVDILKVDEAEARMLSGKSTESDSLREFAFWGISEILLTKGSQGVLVLADGEIKEIEAIPPRKIVDVTGCGDTFTAAFLHQRAKGISPFKAGEFAAQIASKKIEIQGAYRV